MMSLPDSFKAVLIAAAAIVVLGFPPAAIADEKIQIGIVAELSGSFATAGEQFREGIEAFMALHGTRAGDREVEVVYRDITGADPAVAKRLATELIVRDKVAMLGGFYLSSDALAIAPVLTETKTPGVVFNAAAAGIPEKSPYIVRVAPPIWREATATAQWAYKSGKRKAYIAVADFAPGFEVQANFKTEFTFLGGAIVGEDRIPLSTVDFAPIAQRIADSQADVVQIFMPSGAPAIGFIKALAVQGLITKVPVIGFPVDNDLPKFDDSAIGYYAVGNYAPSLDNDANRAFKKAVAEKFGTNGQPPNFLMMGAYDGMQAMYHMIESQKGKPFDGTAAVESVRGYSWQSPRGLVTIEAATRDVATTEYIQRIEKVNGKLATVIVDSFPPEKIPSAAGQPVK
jgi:branched-chain amino acid transport system substrate-binding protein